MDDPELNRHRGADTRHSPFYEWLDNETIRDLVHLILDLTAGERLVLIKRLLPGLVRAVGVVELEAYLSEIASKPDDFRKRSIIPGKAAHLA